MPDRQMGRQVTSAYRLAYLLTGSRLAVLGEAGDLIVRSNIDNCATVAFKDCIVRSVVEGDIS